jgi:hypothetical protein
MQHPRAVLPVGVCPVSRRAPLAQSGWTE